MKTAEPVNTKLVNVTPSMAIEMLRTNSKSDDLNEKRIQEFAKKMDSGRWKPNGAPIVVTEDGMLLDGRHRLWAVFEAGTSIEFPITNDAA